MPREDALSVVLTDLARTLVTDFPIQAILDHLVERIVEILPITSAGVTLIDPGTAPRYVAASDTNALRFERLQTRLHQGPCLLAFTTGQPVAISNLQQDDRFPKFGPAALARGLAAVFTFPLRHGDRQIGALDLYRSSPGDLDDGDMTSAQTLADVAAAYVLNAQSREDARAAAALLEHSATHDPLTGLANRNLLAQRLEQAAEHARQVGGTAAILFVDLDRFKQINDTYGHRVGDELLLSVAERLSGLVRPGDTLARIYGDEFILLCPSLAGDANVEVTQIAEQITDALRRPFSSRAGDLTISASVGIAFAGPGTAITDQLVIDADQAMYEAKRQTHARYQVHDLRGALQPNAPEFGEDDLRAALRHDWLDVAYQPIVDTNTGDIVCVEALLRCTHPTRGPINAATLITLAERTGLIAEIGALVLERACLRRAEWWTVHPNACPDISVNMSASQLMESAFADTVIGIVARTGMDPGALILEITESAFIHDRARATTVLTGLKSHGIRLALDDFGTGYSSLSYLRWLPIDAIKIDRSFITELFTSSATWQIVDAVTNLAHVMGLSVIAEGIETPEQHDQISSIGCDLAQGHLYAQPVTATEIENLIALTTSGPSDHPGFLAALAGGARSTSGC